jgi:hypothetical protein
MICSSFRFHLILISLQNCLVYYIFIFAQFDIQFLSSSSLFKHSLIFNTGFYFFARYIVYNKYIIYQKRLEKKWIPFKFDIRVTKYVVI